MKLIKRIKSEDYKSAGFVFYDFWLTDPLYADSRKTWEKAVDYFIGEWRIISINSDCMSCYCEREIKA